MPQLCPKLTTKLESLKALKQQFDLEIAKAQSLSHDKPEDLVLVRDIKIKLELELKELKEKLAKIDWQEFYQEVFGLKCDFSKVVIPEKREGFDRLIIMAQGLTNKKLFAKTKKLCYPAWESISYIDGFISDRTTATPYAFWVRNHQEADEELKGLSVKQVKERKIATETLNERLLHGLKYFKETGQHLDIRGYTVCSGSSLLEGRMPLIHCETDGDGIGIVYYYPLDQEEESVHREVIV
ncbi:MAG: hypothetical protein WCW02_04565 [Candidatus Buchananbacteria bacterium]